MSTILRKHSLLKWIIIAVIFSMLALSFNLTPYALQTTITVNTFEDRADALLGDGICSTANSNQECSLRAAIQEANSMPGHQTIILPAGTYTLSLRDEPNVRDRNGSTGDLNVSEDLTIQGAGADSTIIDGGGFTGIIETHLSTLTITGVELRNGRAEFVGGSIFSSQGSLVFEDLIFRNNQSDREAGAIYAFRSDINIKRTTFVGNRALNGGGGALSAGWGTLEVSDSLFENNTAFNGGAIQVFGQDLSLNPLLVQIERSAFLGNQGIRGSALWIGSHEATILNSTFSGNLSEGGIYEVIYNFNSLINIVHSTLNISESNGFAITNESNLSFTTLRNSILSGGGSDNCQGPGFVSRGINLEDGDSCRFDSARDFINTDPMLEPLADNGGLTPTHDLGDSSTAIDAADDAFCPDRDQRSAVRPEDRDGDGKAQCDIGAVETYEGAFSAVPDSGTDSADNDTDDENANSTPGTLADSDGICSTAVYFDDFSHPSSGWSIGTGAGFDWAYTSEGEYRVFITSPQVIAFSPAPLSSNSIPTSFCVEADVRQHVTSSLTDLGELGLLFGIDPSSASFTRFGVIPREGSFLIEQRLPSGQFELLIPPTPSSAIQPVNEVNHLAVVARGNDVEFIINGQLVQTLTISSSGGVGVYTRTFNLPQVNARFDNFTVSRID